MSRRVGGRRQRRPEQIAPTGALRRLRLQREPSKTRRIREAGRGSAW
jgi:hypothetical protein